jgi:hypothetical protein
MKSARIEPSLLKLLPVTSICFFHEENLDIEVGPWDFELASLYFPSAVGTFPLTSLPVGTAIPQKKKVIREALKSNESNVLQMIFAVSFFQLDIFAVKVALTSITDSDRISRDRGERRPWTARRLP